MPTKFLTALLALTLSAAVSLGAAAVAPASTTTGATTGCLMHLEACGYPNPHQTGVVDCQALPTWSPADLPAGSYYYSGSGNLIIITEPNVTIEGYNIVNWEFDLDGISGTTLDNDCLSTNGESGQLNAIAGSSNGSTWASQTTIENSTVVGVGCPAEGSRSDLCTTAGVNEDLVNVGNDSLLDNDLLVGGAEPVGLSTGSTLENSYIDSNGWAQGAHTEDVYSSPGVSDMTILHNTLLNPSDQTANVFIDNGSGPCTSTDIAITQNLLAGGGYTMYGCSGATSQNGSQFTFSDNDIARCDGTPTYDPNLGGEECGSVGPSSSTDGSAFGAGYDHHGYWSGGGFFGLEAYTFCGGTTTWTGNTWDDTGAAVACG